MNHLMPISVAAITFLIGISFIQNNNKSFEKVFEIKDTQKTQPEISPKSIQPRFFYLGGGNFKSNGSQPRYSHDCAGGGELGDIHVSHRSKSIEMARHHLNATCDSRFKVIQRGDQLNENGEKIGERCLVEFSGKGAQLVSTEGEKGVWIIYAPTLELLQEFEKSDVYKINKSAADKY
jgi:hypothetical protein